MNMQLIFFNRSTDKILDWSVTDETCREYEDPDCSIDQAHKILDWSVTDETCREYEDPDTGIQQANKVLDWTVTDETCAEYDEKYDLKEEVIHLQQYDKIKKIYFLIFCKRTYI